jgi:hypothetical protein
MAMFNFTSAVFDEDTTFVFGSWVCIADGAGYFRRHLIDDMARGTSSNFCCNLEDFVDNPDAMHTKEEGTTQQLGDSRCARVIGPLTRARQSAMIDYPGPKMWRQTDRRAYTTCIEQGRFLF